MERSEHKFILAELTLDIVDVKGSIRTFKEVLTKGDELTSFFFRTSVSSVLIEGGDL